MRNLKRVLALAMALVMILGMMVIGSSAAKYSDESAIDAKYADAVEILSGMGIFQGTGAGFGPKQILDRASAAALVYRVITGDVKDKQVDLYDFSSFADVAEGVWYTPYITYAADNGYLKGFNGNAMPNDTVTGIQVLAMMLRAAGYGQNGEFEGAGWKDGILTAANDLGITAGISTNDLDKGASRELVAQLIFNVITKVKTVAYTPILNTYIPVTYATDADGKLVGMKTTQTLGEKVFALASEGDHDNWGRPVENWFADNYKKGETGKYDYLYETLYATIEATPDASYTVATSECDIAADLGLRADAVVSKLTVNGDDETGVVGNYFGEKNSDDADDIDRTAMNKVGAQGRLVEFYYNVVTKTYEVVMLDEFLAKVKDVTEVEYDKNGHIKFYADLTLEVYGAAEPVVLTSDENWEYTKGEMLLVYWDEDKAYGEDYAEILGNPDTLVGAQTAFSNKDSHIVEGTEYMDAVQFNLDEAYNQTSDHTWYFDTYGNLIGAEDIDAIYSYGVISAIKWYENDSNLEDGYAIANITYMDGTTEKATIAYIVEADGTTTDYTRGGRNNLSEEASASINTALVRKALYAIETTKQGLILTETQYLPGATTETGRPALTASMNAGKNTQFLVWNNLTKKYETYTGIANVPSYQSAKAVWAFDKVMGLYGDKVAEHVFINSPVAVDSEQEALFFAPGRLTIVANMHPVKKDTVKSFTISGGYVDGVPADLTVEPVDADEADGTTPITQTAIYKILDANKGTLVGLNLKNGNVQSVVLAEDLDMINLTKTYAAYAGDVNEDVKLSNQGVLMFNGQSYDVEGAELISTVGTTLSGIFSADKTERVDAYLYVVYTNDIESLPTDYTKTVKYIYATDVAQTVLTFDGVEYPVLNDKPITVANPEQDGKVFTGWDMVGTDAVEAIMSTSFAADHSVEFVSTWEDATVKYTVTYEVDGVKYGEETVVSGSKLTAPTAPTKENYTFDGWYEGATKWDFATGTVTANTTLEAKFVPAAATITVKGDDGVVAGTIDGKVYGDDVTAIDLTDYVVAGYSFASVKVEGADNTVAGTTLDLADISINVTITITTTANEYTVGLGKNVNKLVNATGIVSPLTVEDDAITVTITSKKVDGTHNDYIVQVNGKDAGVMAGGAAAVTEARTKITCANEDIYNTLVAKYGKPYKAASGTDEQAWTNAKGTYYFVTTPKADAVAASAEITIDMAEIVNNVVITVVAPTP